MSEIKFTKVAGNEQAVLEYKNYVMNEVCVIAKNLGAKLVIDKTTGLAYLPTDERIRLNPNIVHILSKTLDVVLSPFAFSEDLGEMQERHELLTGDLDLFLEVFEPFLFERNISLYDQTYSLDEYEKNQRDDGCGVAPYLLSKEGYYVSFSNWTDLFLDLFDSDNGDVPSDFINSNIDELIKFSNFLGLEYEAGAIEQYKKMAIEFADKYAEDLYVNETVDAAVKLLSGGWNAEEEDLRAVLEPLIQQAEKEAKTLSPQAMVSFVQRKRGIQIAQTGSSRRSRQCYRRKTRGHSPRAQFHSSRRTSRTTASASSSSSDDSGGSEPPQSDPDLPSFRFVRSGTLRSYLKTDRFPSSWRPGRPGLMAHVRRQTT